MEYRRQKIEYRKHAILCLFSAFVSLPSHILESLMISRSFHLNHCLFSHLYAADSNAYNFLLLHTLAQHYIDAIVKYVTFFTQRYIS